MVKQKVEMKNYACLLISLFGSSMSLIIWLSRPEKIIPNVADDDSILIRSSWNLVCFVGICENISTICEIDILLVFVTLRPIGHKCSFLVHIYCNASFLFSKCVSLYA